VTDDLSVYAGLDEVFWCDSRFYRVGAQYRIMPGLTIDVAAEQFEGPFYSYYGHWSENDRLISMLTWSF
jgi:predicted porin